MKEKEHESDRNRIKPDADGSCGVHRRAASDPCRCRFGKDEGTDAPHRLPDPGQRRQAMEYYGDHLYEQGRRRNA